MELGQSALQQLPVERTNLHSPILVVMVVVLVLVMMVVVVVEVGKSAQQHLPVVIAVG